MENHPVLLFDGVCNFCNGTVNFIIKRDKENIFKFAPLQSPEAHELLNGKIEEKNRLQSLVLLENEKIYTRSTAALRILRHLPGMWPLLYGFIIIPAFIRNIFYNIIAKYRYRWFGKRDKCMIPTPEVQSKFLSNHEHAQKNVDIGSQ